MFEQRSKLTYFTFQNNHCGCLVENKLKGQVWKQDALALLQGRVENALD